MKVFGTLIVIALIVGAVFISSYNGLNRLDEGVTAAWSEVVNQYQRRADLVPNLVKSVKAYTSHEQEVFEEVARSRAGVGKIDLNEALSNPQVFTQFDEAQQKLGGALTRLLAVAEAYPELKADAVYRDLMTQLEGTENRIGVARKRYIEAVQGYNTTVRTLPASLIAGWFGFGPKANFTVANEQEIAVAPTIDL